MLFMPISFILDIISPQRAMETRLNQIRGMGAKDQVASAFTRFKDQLSIEDDILLEADNAVARFRNPGLRDSDFFDSRWMQANSELSMFIWSSEQLVTAYFQFPKSEYLSPIGDTCRYAFSLKRQFTNREISEILSKQKYGKGFEVIFPLA